MSERGVPNFPYRIATVLIGVCALLALPALILLPAALGWPDIIQGTPASEALPIIREQFSAFRLGYGLLVLDALLFLPAAYFIVRAMRDRRGTLARLVYGVALASAALRALWWTVGLTGYPVLDGVLLSPEVTAPAREAIDVTYIAVNGVFSTVQEDIGVNILGALFTILVSVAILRSRSFPRWLGVWGVLGGLLLISSSAELVGIGTGDVIPLLAPTVTQLWFLAMGVAVWRKHGELAKPLLAAGAAR